MTVTNEKQGMRYFSPYTYPKGQNSILDSQSQTWLLGLSDGLARAIMNNMIDELLQTRQFVDTQVKRQKVSIKCITFPKH
jgi:hypothetical protein